MNETTSPIEGVLDEIKNLSNEPRVFEIEGTPVLALPPGWASSDLHQFCEHPRRVHEEFCVIDLESFVRYCDKYADSDSIIRAHQSTAGLSLTAIIDYHEPAGDDWELKAKWRDHKAIFTATASCAWNHWQQANGRPMRQADFARFLYDNQAEIKDPGGAEMLEIIQTLKATASGEFKDFRDLHTGSQELIYKVKVSASAGTADRPLELPTQFTIEMACFHGCPPCTFQADLLIQVPHEDNQPVMMSYRLYRPEDVLRAQFEKVVADVGERTSLDVYLC